MPLQDLVVVDSAETLEQALSTIADLDLVGIDVERADWDRYYRAAALIQVGGNGRVVVIDPLGTTELAALDEFLQHRVSVFHAVENDLDPIVSLGVKPSELCDTAVAAAVLGLPTGLEGLLRDLLGVELSGDKAAMQRANWEARPLTSQMLSYAAGDVADLPELWEVLAERLDETERREWYEQELAALLAMPSVEDRRKWSRTKGAGRLDPRSRTRLRELWAARENLGRDTDTAPGRIASDAVLVDLASKPPQALNELGRRGVRRQAVRDFGPALMDALAAGEAAEPDPRAPGRAPADNDRQLIDRLRQVRSARAKVLGIEAGVLCPSRTLAPALLADPPTPEDLREALGLRPWQWEQLGHAFCEAVGLDGPGVPPPPPDPPDQGDLGMTDQLNPDALHKGLNELDGWSGTSAGIAKTYRFPDADAASSFVERVSVLADRMDHHPDVDIDGASVGLTLVTHSAGGVTQKDLDLATAIDTGEAHGDANPDNPAAGRNT